MIKCRTISSRSRSLRPDRARRVANTGDSRLEGERPGRELAVGLASRRRKNRARLPLRSLRGGGGHRLYVLAQGRPRAGGRLLPVLAGADRRGARSLPARAIVAGPNDRRWRRSAVAGPAGRVPRRGTARRPDPVRPALRAGWLPDDRVRRHRRAARRSRRSPPARDRGVRARRELRPVSRVLPLAQGAPPDRPVRILKARPRWTRSRTSPPASRPRSARPTSPTRSPAVSWGR